jgi:cytochrome c biogenesis protein ResB
MNRLKHAWDALGSMRFAVYLLASCSGLFMAGAIFYRLKPGIFLPLNSTMLFEWLGTYGISNSGHTWWFFLLIGIFFFLGINTFLCTLERMIALIKLRNRRSLKSLLYLLSPHIMHIAFLVLIVGYLVLYTFGVNSYNNILKPGFKRQISGSNITMEIRNPSFSTVSRKQNEFLEGRHISAAYTLVLHDAGRTVQKRLALNSPCLYKGYSIHVADFNPPRAKSMTSAVWVNLTIRKNAGIPIFMTGIVLFAAGICLYLLSAFTNGQQASITRR